MNRKQTKKMALENDIEVNLNYGSTDDVANAKANEKETKEDNELQTMATELQQSTFKLKTAEVQQRMEEKDRKMKQIMCCVLPLTILMFIGLVIMIVFDILSLVYTPLSEVKDICPSSNMWEWMLTQLIVGTIISCITSDKEEDIFVTRTIRLSVSMAFTIWGLVELVGPSCAHDLSHTLLFKMTTASVWISWAIYVIVFVGGCIYVCVV